jgi:hypothetical protein
MRTHGVQQKRLSMSLELAAAVVVVPMALEVEDIEAGIDAGVGP